MEIEKKKISLLKATSPRFSRGGFGNRRRRIMIKEEGSRPRKTFPQTTTLESRKKQVRLRMRWRGKSHISIARFHPLLNILVREKPSVDLRGPLVKNRLFFGSFCSFRRGSGFTWASLGLHLGFTWERLETNLKSENDLRVR